MTIKNLTLPVQGMHCASCVNTIERALKKVDGVQTANLAAERATVTFDSTLAMAFSLVSVVSNALRLRGFRPPRLTAITANQG